MQGRDTGRRVLELVVLMVPVALIKLVAPMFGGPESASAITPSNDNDRKGSLVLVEPEWTDEQVAAAEYLRAQERSLEKSPFKHARSSGDPAPVEIENPMDLEVSVTMIMQAPGGSIALVDGETCRIGSKVQDGLWKITVIDALGRKVAFENVKNGKTEVRSLDR